MLVGIGAALLVRFLLRRMNLEYQISPLILTYPCLAALFCFSFWLFFYGGS